MMRGLCLTLARFSLCAWVGAAALFVVTSVREASSPEFASLTKDALALLRFPHYYQFGFALVGLALVSGLVALTHPAVSRARMVFCIALMLAALVTMVGDFLYVYSPLAAMLLPPGSAKPANFQELHKMSMYVNSVSVGLCLLAALVLCAPDRKPIQG